MGMMTLKKNGLRRKLSWLILASVFIFQSNCAKPPDAETACGFVQNSWGQRVSWKSQVPIKLYFDSSVPSQFYQAIQNAIQTWEKGIGRKVFVLSGSLPASAPAQDGVSVIYWLGSWEQTAARQQANTTIYWVDNRITEADIRVNAQNHTMSMEPSMADVDVESLLLHEFGHVLGLRHIDDAPSVMAKSLMPGYQRRSLYAADTASIKCEY
jgi:hypothetical protein